MTYKTYDVVLVGGGVMGCATAYYLLKNDPNLKVAIFEKDPTYVKSSTVLSDGNTRIQFNIKENIQMSIYGLEVMNRFSEEMAINDEPIDIAFRRQGNLFLVDEEGKEQAHLGLALQKALGCQVDWMTPGDIAERYPLLELKEIVGGTFGKNDGTMDPWAVLLGYKNKVIDLGGRFENADIVSLLVENDSVSGIRTAIGEKVFSKIVVNSAGPWATQFAESVGISLPIQPVKRQVFVIETAVRPESLMPLIAFPTGLYLIHEHGGVFTCGKSLVTDPVGFEFNWDQNTFTEYLWPELVDQIPDFDRLKIVRGWAGLYAVNTFDGNAILGEWPELAGFFLANGFSGHGFQQCHAVGRYLAELILDQAVTLDLGIFSAKRILDNQPVFENRQRIV